GFAQAPHRRRRRRASPRGQPPAQPVRADAEDDEDDARRQPRQDAAQHEGHAPEDALAMRLVAAIMLALAAPACAQTLWQRLTRDIYKELIEIRTVHPDGDNTAAARAMAARLLAAGFDPGDVQVFEPA